MSSLGQTTQTTTNSITINFTPPSNLLITYYIITATPINGGTTIIQKFGAPETSYIIKGLNDNTTYSFTLSAVNSYGQSKSSNPLITSTLPMPPSLLSTILTYNSASINFLPPYGPIETYRITITPFLGGSTTTQFLSSNINNYNFTNLSSSTYYNISIITNSTTGLSSPRITIKILTTPSAPINLSASSATISTINISFTADTSNVNSFTVTAVPTGGGTTIIQNFNYPASNYTIIGLISATIYNISLVAINSSGSSPISTINYSTIPNAPTSLNFISSTSSTALIGFTAPSGTITSYTISAVDASGVAITPQTFNAPATNYTITGLSSAKTYTVSLVANVANGSSATSSTISVLTVPNPPTGLTGVSSTNNSITFSFTPSTGTITNYTVNAVDSSGVAILPQSFSAPASSYTITGLPYTLYAVSYSITLTATNNSGISVLSNVLTYNKSATIIPNPPTGLAFNGYTSTSISVSWTMPTDGSITSYIIKAIDTNNNTIIQTTNAPATTYNITGLLQVVTYTISISATNMAGTSNYSTTITAVTADAYQVSSNMLLCYSVRLFIPSYTGPIFTIRRSNDNVTQDFYTNSTQSYLTTNANGTGTSYATWIGVNTGYITKWYDQSGKGNHSINTANNATQPILIQNPNLGRQLTNYIVQWITSNSTVLNFTTSITPNAIISTFYNTNANYGTILSGSGTNVLRFGTSGFNINGSNVSTDWYYASSGTKLAYDNNLNISSTYLLPGGISEWNYMSLSVQTPAFAFSQMGKDLTTPSSNSLNGYMIDMICYNQQLSESSMRLYYTNISSTIPLITAPYTFSVLGNSPGIIYLTEDKQKIFYLSSGNIYMRTWNGYTFVNDTLLISSVPSSVFIITGDGNRVVFVTSLHSFQIYTSIFNGTTYSTPTASPLITTGTPYINFNSNLCISMTSDGSKLLIGSVDQITYMYFAEWDSKNLCYKTPRGVANLTAWDYPSTSITDDGLTIVATLYGGSSSNYPQISTWDPSANNYSTFSEFGSLTVLRNNYTNWCKISNNLSFIASAGSNLIYAYLNNGSYSTKSLSISSSTNIQLLKDNSAFAYVVNYSNNYFLYIHKIS